LQEAAKWYAKYYALAPDNLKRLAEVCTRLEEAGVEDEACREAAELVMGRQGDKETRSKGAGKIRNSQPASPPHRGRLVEGMLKGKEGVIISIWR